MTKLFLALLTLGFPALHAYDIPGFTPDRIVEYKQTTDSSGSGVGLDLHIFTPDDHKATDHRPAIIFFFGGGWNSGSPSQFHPHCEYLADRGMVAISAEYRVGSIHGTSPRECVMDGKSAIRWLRENANTLGIDPNRIAASGGSAGGHVAAAAGTVTSYEEEGEDLTISSRPNALVLYNPVFDNGPGGYGYSRVQTYWEDFSPIHNITATAPPTTVFLGTNDNLIPVETARSYQALMEAEERRCDLHLYEGQPHSFFNFDVPDDTSGPFDGFPSTLLRTDEFLVSLGYLENRPEAPTPVTNWVAIFGNPEFADQSAATNSPVTTDASADAIAAPFPTIGLRDGEFIRMTGSVTIDAPLSGRNFRIGIFGGNSPTTEGVGSGQPGIWAEAPATSASNIAAGTGTGLNHPFETPNAAILGSVPAANTVVPAGTEIKFTLMLARNASNLDLSVNFTDQGAYDQSQNLLKQNITNFDFDRIAFLMTGSLEATQAAFSNIEITSGPVLPGFTKDPIVPTNPIITYLDAVEGPGGNTFATGSNQSETDWLLDPGSSAANQTQWSKRAFGNGTNLFQALHTLPDTIPQLTTRIPDLADGAYNIWVFYWDQVESDTQNWIISAGLDANTLESYSSPGEPAVAGAITTNVTNAAALTFSNPPLVVDGDGLRNLFGVNLGQVTVQNGSSIEVYLDNLIGNNNNRTWYDGVGYAAVLSQETEMITSFTLVAGGVWELTLRGAGNTDYVLRSSSTLDFNSGTLLTNLIQGNPADPGIISGTNNSIITTDEKGNARIRMTLAGDSKDFVRAELAP